MPDRMPKMSDRLPEYMPSKMPDRMPEYMSYRMPEYMSGRMSEYVSDKLSNILNIYIYPNIHLEMSWWGPHEVKYFFGLSKEQFF